MTGRTPIPKASSSPELIITYDWKSKYQIERKNYFIDYEAKKPNIDE